MVLLQEIGPFQRLVRKLIHLTTASPNISYAVGDLCIFSTQKKKFMHYPTPDLGVVSRVLRYLKSSPGRDCIPKNTDLDVMFLLMLIRLNVKWIVSWHSGINFVKGRLVPWKSIKHRCIEQFSN